MQKPIDNESDFLLFIKTFGAVILIPVAIVLIVLFFLAAR
jgi:hypothetical protein